MKSHILGRHGHISVAGKSNRDASSRGVLIDRGAGRLAQMIAWIVTFAVIGILAALSTGCQHAVPQIYTPPPVAPVAQALHRTQAAIVSAAASVGNAAASLGSASNALSDALKDESLLATNITPAFLPDWKAMTSSIAAADTNVLEAITNAGNASNNLVAAATNAADTDTNLVSYATGVTNQAVTLNKTSAKLSYVQGKYSAAIGLIWKWRLLFFGLLALLVAYLVIKYGGKLVALAATAAAKFP